MARDLTPLFDPRSVAIVGASNDPAKWGNWLARGALTGGHRRPVYLINRNGGQVLGHETYRSLEELPDAPDLVVVAVPAGAFEQTVDAALAKGARALVGITAGLGESGPEGLERERALVQRVRDAGALLLGPNCLGVFDAGAELGLASNEFPAGSIGLVSQSGNLALEVGLMARLYGLGFSRFASIGNQADVDLAELVAALGEHEPTRLIAIYAEDFRDGRAFVNAAAHAGKPVVLLTVGRSDAGGRAAQSHTGALVSEFNVVEAAARRAGAHMVSTPAQMVDLAQALLQPRRLAGNRVAVLGDGGGHGAVASDVAAAAGFELPGLSDALQSQLKASLPPTAVAANPVDLAGGGEQDFFSFSRTARGLLESGEVDGVLMTGYFGGYSQYSDEFLGAETEVAGEIARAAVDSGRPLVAQSMYHDAAPNQALRAAGVPVYATIEAAVAALAALAERPQPPGVAALPLADSAPVDSGYFASRRLLEAAGVPFVAAREVGSRPEAVAAAAELGYPIVLKALGLVHKSDAGGVVVGITGEADLGEAFDRLARSLSPPSFSVERMAPLSEGLELIIGTRMHARFGPAVMVGLGGIYAELFKETAVELTPVTQLDAERMLRSLRGSALLTGARGAAALDVVAAAGAVVALSGLAATRTDIAEIDVNPLLVTPTGALGLDARIILTEGESDAD